MTMEDQPQPDELEQQRKKEHAQRASDAHACAKLLSTLMLGEKLTTGPDSYVMAVPGGWVFYETHKAGITSTFVPQPTTPPPMLKKEKAIILPGGAK